MRLLPPVLLVPLALVMIWAASAQAAPVITSITPASANAGAADLLVTVNGTGFSAGGATAVIWTPDTGSSPVTLTPSSFTATQLQVTVPAVLMQTSGTAGVVASNPGGSLSNSVTFTINPGGGGGTSPGLTALTPNSATAGGAAFTLTVTGTGFVAGATVKWNGSSLTTTFVNATQLTASVTSALIQNSGSASIVVSNPGGAVSGALTFTVNSAGGGGTSLAISSLAPNAATAGGVAFTLTVTGTGFVSVGTTILWNGSSLPTTFVSATQVTASVPAALIQNSGSATVQASNPGGSVSGTLTFTINPVGSAPPAFTSLSPSEATAGGAGFTLNVGGSGFVSASTVAWNGTALSTVFVNTTQLFALVPAGFIQASGSANITVTNPGSTTSAALTFTINPAESSGTPPVLTSLAPNSAVAGGATFTITVAGTGFVSGAAIRWNGSGLTTAFVSATQLTASVPAALIQNSGSGSIVVSNPGGAVSGTLIFTVKSATAGGTIPAISSLSPIAATAGGAAFVLTVNGSAFVSGATVGWNGSSLATAFISATQLLGLVPPALIQTVGSVSVTVTSPAGAVSGASTFTISPAGGGGTLLSISAFTPNSATAGAAGFSLAVSGAGFVSGAAVQWNGSSLGTTFVSATQLTASVPAALVQNSGSASIAVLNPGGTASDTAIFNITAVFAPLAITDLSPNSVVFGGPAFTLSVKGTGFVSGSTVQWNGSALATALLSETLLTATAPATLIQRVGRAGVVVLNPDGTASNPLAFTVSGTQPALTALTPDSTPAGRGAMTLCAAGARFVSGAVVQWNGAPLETALLSDTLVCATVPANLTAAEGTANISVATLAGTSNTLVFTIVGPPTIASGGVVPLGGSVPIIQAGSWVSINGASLADKTYTWGGDFPTSLGGVSVTINDKPAYLWTVSPSQINLQAPDDSATGNVTVVVKTAIGSASSTVILASHGPAFKLLEDGKHVSGVIPSLNGTGALGGGSYDLVGPSGAFSFPTRPVKAGETMLLYGVGFGPTTPPVPAGQTFSGAAPTTTPVTITIGGVPADVAFAGITEAGFYQINVTIPPLPAGDQPLQALVNGIQTTAGPLITVQ